MRVLYDSSRKYSVYIEFPATPPARVRAQWHAESQESEQATVTLGTWTSYGSSDPPADLIQYLRDNHGLLWTHWQMHNLVHHLPSRQTRLDYTAIGDLGTDCEGSRL